MDNSHFTLPLPELVTFYSLNLNLLTVVTEFRCPVILKGPAQSTNGRGEAGVAWGPNGWLANQIRRMCRQTDEQNMQRCLKRKE